MPDFCERAADAIRARLQEKERLLVAIDGRCAAGKSTLAAHLQQLLFCNIIPMDDFFLRPGQRTEERLLEPGGNVDYERFEEEVLLPLKEGKDFSYRPYDCRRQILGNAVEVHANPVNIVEGSYSCHPRLAGYYDLRIFLSVNPQEQLRRIAQRNGASGITAFRDKWIVLEERYFSFYNVRERCDLHDPSN